LSVPAAALLVAMSAACRPATTGTTEAGKNSAMPGPQLTRSYQYWRGHYERTPGAFLCVKPDATDVFVACDRWPDCSDMRRFGLDAVRLSGARTKHEEALAVWQWMRRVKISTNGEAPTDPFHPERDGAQVNDPVKMLNVYGAHWCSGLGRITALIWRGMGNEGQALHRYSHGMAALYYRDEDGESRYHLFDCNFGGYALDRTGKRVLGMDDFSTDYWMWMYPWYFGETWPMPTHRVELSLRRGEKLERIWGNWGKPFHNNINKSCTNPPRSERGPYEPVYGNGRWTYSPDLSNTEWVRGLAEPPENMASGKLVPAAAGRPASAVWHFRTPYIAVESEITIKAFRRTENDSIRLFLSTDNGRTWKEHWAAPAGKTGEQTFTVKLDDKFKVIAGKWKVPEGFSSPFGRYAYRLKIEMQAQQAPGNCRIDDVGFSSIVQQNLFSLPQLQPGRNNVTVRGQLAAGAALKITYLWDDPMGKSRENVTVVEKAPFTYEIVAAGKEWTDCACKSITVEAVAATGEGNRTVVKEKVGTVPEHPPVAPASASRMRWQRRLHSKKNHPSREQVLGWLKDPGKVKFGLVWASELEDAAAFDAVRKVAFDPEICKSKGMKELALLALYNTDREKARKALLEIAADKECRTGWKFDEKNPAVAGGHWMSGVCIIGQMAAASGWKEFVPVLVEALDSKYAGEERNRMSVLRSLGAIAAPGDEDAAAAARKSLAMTYPYMLTEAAILAGKVGDKASIPRLRELLDHPFMVVRRRAALALGMLGDAASAPRLRESLSGIRKREVLDHTKYNTELWFDENMRAACAEGLGLMRDGESLPALKEALAGEPVPWVRERIETAISRIERGR
jgi:hypothetical protein